MFNVATVITTIFAYVVGLFAIAYFTERRDDKGFKLINSPLIYSLSLAVYCTSWTFYGSVGSASKSGLIFITIYLGPMISMTLWWSVLRKLVRIKQRLRITSIVDFISARYDKSEGVGVIAACLVTAGTMPYVALQLKAIVKTMSVMVSDVGQADTEILGSSTGLFVVGLMTLCTLFFGVRKLDSSERHPGMILVLAVECIVKLVAFLCVGFFVTYSLNNGFDNLISKMPEVMDDAYSFVGIRDLKDVLTWMTYLILASSAILFLPRQFHVAVVENSQEKHIKTAKWLFPLYLILINLFVLPITISGKLAGLDASLADTFVLLLPITQGQTALSMLTFIGGFSAAMGMIMIATVSVATIITNHILIPLFTRVDSLKFLTKHLIKLRWLVASLFIIGSYSYMKIVGGKYALVAMGMVSFAAALQFAPVIIGSLYWKKGSRFGAYSALILGATIWFYTLVIPAFVKSGWMKSSLLNEGLFGSRFLRPEALFGFEGYHHLTNAVLWTMIFNIGGYVLGSILFPQSNSEKRIAKEFVEALPHDEINTVDLEGVEDTIDLSEKKVILEGVLNSYYNDNQVREIISSSLEKFKVDSKEKISLPRLSDLLEEIEKVLAGVIGTAAAHQAISSANLLSKNEKDELSKVYGDIMANMMISPREMNKKIILFQEREKMMEQQTKILENTIQKRELELEEQKAIAFHASKMSSLGEMAGGIAHEINNPLAIIASSIGLMRKMQEKGKMTPEKFNNILDNINATLERVSKIISGLRTVSRRTDEDDFRFITMLDMMTDVLGLCSEKFKNYGIHIDINLEDPLYQIELYCDQVQFSQVLVNLISNSYDAIEMLEEKWVKIRLEQRGNYLILSIEDSGKGIPKEIKEKIFQPFYTSKPIGKGTGLGLSISKKILEKHGGSLEIDNESKNTRFIMTIPFKDRSEEAS